MTALWALLCVAGFLLNGAPQVIGLWQTCQGDARMGPYTVRVLRNGEGLEFSGGITYGAERELRRYLDEMGAVKIVHLTSPGGRVSEARRMSRLVQSRNLNTYVPERCESACALVFLAGRERLVAPDARLGFREPDFPALTFDERRAAAADQTEKLRQLGVSDEFAAQAAQPDMWYPTASELVSAGVATWVVNAADFGGTALDPSLISAQVRQQLSIGEPFASIARIDPETYAVLLDRFESGLRRGMRFDEMRAEARPILANVFAEILPYASDENLLEYTRLVVRAAASLRAEPSDCYYYFNQDRATPEILSALEIRQKDLIEEEQRLEETIFTQYTGESSSIPSDDDIAASLGLVNAALTARFGDNLSIMTDDAVAPDMHGTYCAMLESTYGEALKLPRSETIPLLRYMFGT